MIEGSEKTPGEVLDSLNKILGVKVDFGMSMETILSRVETSMLKDGKCHYICTTNPEFVMDCQKDEEFKRIVNEADLSVPDGVGLLIAHEYIKRMHKIRAGFVGINNMTLRKVAVNVLLPLVGLGVGLQLGFETLVLGKIFGNRIPGVALVEELCRLSSEKGYSMFFLGGKAKSWLGKYKESDSDVATQAADGIKKIFKNVHIIGSTSRFSREQKDDEKTLEMIKNCMQNAGIARLDLLFVAYNHNNQEKWIKRNISKIPANVAIGVGGTFDYMAGIKETSPYIIRKHGLEWFYRLLTQPWRFKRIFVAFPIFPLRVYVSEL